MAVEPRPCPALRDLGHVVAYLGRQQMSQSQEHEPYTVVLGKGSYTLHCTWHQSLPRVRFVAAAGASPDDVWVTVDHDAKAAEGFSFTLRGDTFDLEGVTVAAARPEYGIGYRAEAQGGFTTVTLKSCVIDPSCERLFAGAVRIQFKGCDITSNPARWVKDVSADGECALRTPEALSLRMQLPAFKDPPPVDFACVSSPAGLTRAPYSFKYMTQPPVQWRFAEGGELAIGGVGGGRWCVHRGEVWAEYPAWSWLGGSLMLLLFDVGCSQAAVKYYIAAGSHDPCPAFGSLSRD
eukprot:TRINITY_DN12790_c0_g1_i2.p1 TRINITY_DN12790_c0_g1~~TRINITY_DN12790_c0_g1_i2.p1  ORF type:complete len:293 (+),score=55.02 TRINITY_DN12790_c0_g1_i2:418-1296(+)